MPMKIIDHWPQIDLARTHWVSDDFYAFNTGDMWTSLAADTTSTVAASDAAGGILVMTMSNTDENEAAVKTTQEVFKFAAGKPLVFEAVISFTAATTANVAVGFADAVGANLMQDAGAGPKATASMAIIYRQDDGGTVWKCRSQIGAGVGVTTSVSTTAAGGAQVLKIEVRPTSSTVAEIVYLVDGIQLRDSGNVPIKHQLVFTNATEMQAFVYAKTGAAAQLVVNVDKIDAGQLR